ncbi:MAG: CYTH and CHAD domain-containing protein [Candidatus Dormibacteraeota bacterium]|nr:CYTH and CHAD domain-containing protein [Candidatus Dormibacteraeota bacterium]
MAEATGVPREREVKLQAAPGFHVPQLSGLAPEVEPGAGSEERLETTYWDTHDLRLARWGVSLRHRGAQGWTLKLPGRVAGPLLERPELLFAGTARTVPAPAQQVLRAYVRGSQLEPVARLSTWRRRVPLLGPGGRQVAEVVDDEVSVLDGRRVAARFREVEVELQDGGDHVLEPLLARLRAAGAGAPDPTPKHVRALGPSAVGPPEVADTPLSAVPRAGEVVTNALAAAVGLILRHDPGIRLGGDPEDVHQARVGTRRLRSHLRTFRPLLNGEWADALRDELGWLADELGRVRDQEVLTERLQGHVLRLPEVDRRSARAVVARLEAEAIVGRAELLAGLASQRYVDLLERLVAAANRPVLDETAALPASDLLPRLVRRPWRGLRRAVRSLSAEPEDVDLHRCRIFAKRVRYAAEAVAPAVGPEAQKFAAAAAALQGVLGDHQDAAGAEVWLRAHAGVGRRAFAAGAMAALEMGAAEAARARWRKSWRRLDKRALRSWIPA